jgi:hypothetical protein
MLIVAGLIALLLFVQHRTAERDEE